MAKRNRRPPNVPYVIGHEASGRAEALSGAGLMIVQATKEARVAHTGRNEPCSCGSGRKTKRCCGIGRGPGPEELARAFLASEARGAAIALVHVGDDEFKELFDDLLDLPALDLSLVVRLPDLLRPELGRLLDAVADDDPDALEDALPGALARVDTFQARAALARAVRALREAGRIHPRLAALALIDLEKGKTLLTASLLRAAAIATGRARTPGGLLVAA
jgi:hypothetical protein